MARRINVTITEQQYEFLNRMAWRTGLSIAELIRRMIDFFMRAREPKLRIGGYEVSISVRRRTAFVRRGRRPSFPLRD